MSIFKLNEATSIQFNMYSKMLTKRHTSHHNTTYIVQKMKSHFLPDFRLILRVILAIFVGFGAFQKGTMAHNNVMGCPVGIKKS